MILVVRRCQKYLTASDAIEFDVAESTTEMHMAWRERESTRPFRLENRVTIDAHTGDKSKGRQPKSPRPGLQIPRGDAS